jgi:hypothetical protein
MAVKNARSRGNKGRDASGDIDLADDADTIAALIDGDDPGDGVGKGNRGSRDAKSDSRGNDIDGGKRGKIGEAGAGNSADDHRGGEGAGAGKRGGVSSSDAGTGSGQGAAREEKKPVRESVSRVEKPIKVKGIVEDEKVELPASSKELIGDLYSVIFWMVGQATGVPEWKLKDNGEENEAEFLGERTEAFVKSLGKRRATALMKSLGKIGPTLGFVSAIAMVTAPRVKLTIQRAKHHGNPQSVPPAIPGSPAATPGAAESSTTSGNGVDAGSNQNGAALRERSFAAADFEQVTQGHARESSRDFPN